MNLILMIVVLNASNEYTQQYLNKTTTPSILKSTRDKRIEITRPTFRKYVLSVSEAYFNSHSD